MKRKTVWVIISAFIIAIAGILICLADHSRHSFSIDKWKNVENRMRIVDSLLRKNHLIAMTRDEIRNLMGSPSRESGTDAWIYHLSIQPEGETLEIIPFLRINFEDDLVISYQVDPNA